MKTLHSALLNDNYFEDLFLCCCEKQEYPPASLSEIWMRDHHTICYITAGNGNIKFGRQNLSLSAGQGIWIPPGRACRYQADSEQTWHCLRIGFTGRRAESVLSELSLHEPGRRFFISNQTRLEEISKKLLDSTRGTLMQIFLRQSLFYEFLSILAADMQEEAPLDNSFNPYVTRAIGWIREHYAEHDLRVSDVASHVGISRNYLFTLFKESMGHSPQEYITSFRLNRARELLIGTEYSVDSISYSCGYEDPAVFSRAFKKKYRMTPINYRTHIPAHHRPEPQDPLPSQRASKNPSP